MAKANDKESSPASAVDLNGYPPIADNCRARSMWSINESAECLVPPPQNCGYVLEYASRFYCNHPRRQEIVIRTIKISREATS